MTDGTIEPPPDLNPLVIHGDVLGVLSRMRPRSVHCSVFSPPFWGLRRYDVCVCSLTRHATAEFRAWGGVAPRGESTGQISADDRRNRKEPDPNCPWCHGTGTIPGMETLWGGDPACEHLWTDTSPRRPRRLADTGNLPSHGNYDAKGGRVCQRCGGWWGSLGLEPTPRLYVDHTVLYFRALRDVMRDDGIIWAEIGDTYITHPAGLTGPARWAASTIRVADHTGHEQAGMMDKRQPRRTWDRKNDTSPRPRKGGRPYGGLAEGNLAFIPHRVALALQDDGWIVRQDIVGVWERQNPMPESVRNRPSRSHSYIFQVTKNMAYYWDRDNARQAQTGGAHSRGKGSRSKPLPPPGEGVRANSDYNSAMIDQPPPEAGRNVVSVWRFATHAYKGKHYATYPVELPRRCITIGTSDRGCCPECGAPFERVTTLGIPDRDWQRASGGDARGEYSGESKGGYADTGAEDPSDVKRRILGGMIPRVTVGWRPRCLCFPDPCDRCGKGWTHRKVLRRVSNLSVRDRDAHNGTGTQRPAEEAEDFEDLEDEEYGRQGFRIVEEDRSWPGCKCGPPGSRQFKCVSCHTKWRVRSNTTAQKPAIREMDKGEHRRLSGVRDNIRPNDPQEETLLFGPMRASGSRQGEKPGYGRAEEEHSDEMRGVRGTDDPQGGAIAQTFLLEAVREPVVGEESRNNAGVDEDAGRVRHGDGAGVAGSTDPLRHAAPAGDGEDRRAPPPPGRGGPPQEREERRQQAGEPRVTLEAGTRSPAEAPASDGGSTMSSLPAGGLRGGACPACGGELELISPGLVPPVVLDPFAGSGTTLLVARKLYRQSIGIELSSYYTDMMNKRLAEETAGLARRYVPQRRLSEYAEAV